MRTPLMRIRLGGLVLALVFTVAVLGYRFLGGYDWLSAVYMVVITVSTVGYGETSDLSPQVQALTVAVILVGISASVYTFGGLIQVMLEGELERVLGKRRMIKDIQGLSGHSIICGYGRMGHNLALELKTQGRQLVVIDHDSEKVAEATSNGFLCVLGDATDEVTLQDAGLDRASTLVSTFPNDAESVFITLTARNLNSGIKIISRAERESTQQKLRQAGADTIVMPTVVGARQMGRMITRPSTAHLINLVDEGSNREFDLDELIVEEGNRLVGMTVEKTEAHRRHRLLVVAIKDASGVLRFNPAASEQFADGDVVMVVGHRDHIGQFRSEFGMRTG
ncbi:MAG: potassium channel protein [Planctomycetaceae bacterium]|nr:potassium channel protein [Planctomycetaceae bacterium]